MSYIFVCRFLSFQFCPPIPNLSLIHWKTMKLQWNYWLQTFLAFATKRKSEMTSCLNNDYDVINYFAKFEKFLPHTITIPSFMTIESQMLELDRGLFCPPPYKIGCQNTPYKLGLSKWIRSQQVLGMRKKNPAYYVSCTVGGGSVPWGIDIFSTVGMFITVRDIMINVRVLKGTEHPLQYSRYPSWYWTYVIRGEKQHLLH